MQKQKKVRGGNPQQNEQNALEKAMKQLTEEKGAAAMKQLGIKNNAEGNGAGLQAAVEELRTHQVVPSILLEYVKSDTAVVQNLVKAANSVIDEINSIRAKYFHDPLKTPHVTECSESVRAVKNMLQQQQTRGGDASSRSAMHLQDMPEMTRNTIFEFISEHNGIQVTTTKPQMIKNDDAIIASINLLMDTTCAAEAAKANDAKAAQCPPVQRIDSMWRFENDLIAKEFCECSSASIQGGGIVKTLKKAWNICKDVCTLQNVGAGLDVAIIVFGVLSICTLFSTIDFGASGTVLAILMLSKTMLSKYKEYLEGRRMATGANGGVRRITLECDLQDGPDAGMTCRSVSDSGRTTNSARTLSQRPAAATLDEGNGMRYFRGALDTVKSLMEEVTDLVKAATGRAAGGSGSRGRTRATKTKKATTKATKAKPTTTKATKAKPKASNATKAAKAVARASRT